MSVHDEIGARMKEYEAVSKTTLIKRMPVIMRIDGKSFHTFTRGFKKPFDRVLAETMQLTMHELCRSIQGAVLGYTQSDEITIVLVDYKKLNSQPWFGNEVQKMCSIGASMATMIFNNVFRNIVEDLSETGDTSYPIDVYKERFGEAQFDCRVFNIPREEVTNNLFWRQIDARRNSIEMLGRAYFSNRELFKKNCSDIKEMLLQKGVDWGELPTYLKYGSCAVKRVDPSTCRDKWIIDKCIPLFVGDDREYVDRLIFIEGEV